MARLADDPATADILVLSPVLGRDRVQGRSGRRRERSRAGEKLPHLRSRRGEAPVEPDHENRAARAQLLDHSRDGLQFLLADAERLLDEDVLAGPERGDDQLCMKVVSGRDEDRVRSSIVPDLTHVGGGEREPLATPGVLCVEPSRGADAPQLEALLALEGREKDEPGKVARSDHAYADRALDGGHPTQLDPAGQRLLGGGILQDDSGEWLLALRHERVSVRRAIDWEPVGRELLDGQLARRDDVEHRLHVPLGGPADLAERVVDPLLLVHGIPSTGPQRRRDCELEFLLKERRAGEVQPHDANQNDATLRPAHLGRELDRLVARGGGGDDDGVHAATA